MELLNFTLEIVDPTTILLGISLLILFGKLSEYIFHQFAIPDSLLLIGMGILIGPFGFGWITDLNFTFVSVFTSFALLFLLFDGSLEISLENIVRGFTSGIVMTMTNYVLSVSIITGVLYFLEFPFYISLLAGFMLGGISSSFVVPLLKQINLNPKTYSELTFESALTDVLCIVSSLTLMNLVQLDTFNTRQTASILMASVSVAFFIGIISAFIWIFIEKHVFKESKEYMLTIAALVLTAVLTEFFGGNGALSALFFGLTLRNSKGLTNIFVSVTTKVQKEKNMAMKGQLGINAMKPSEHYFHNEISFFVKTIFFVYIGTLLNFSDTGNLLIGGGIIILLLFGRMITYLITRKQSSFDRKIISSIFGRGLAAAALVQTAISMQVENIGMITGIVHIVIVGSILLSSLRIFFVVLPEKKRLMATGSEKKQNKK